MVQKKRQSKRLTLKQKYKVQRKVKDHNKKLRKEAKMRLRAGGGGPSVKALKKDPGLPNMMPFKESFLRRAAAAEEKIRKGTAEAHRRRGDTLAKRRGLAPGAAAAAAAGAGGLEALVGAAEARGRVFEDHEAPAAFSLAPDAEKATTQNRRAYYRQLRQVLDKADIIIEVLDARDPMGCRARAVERQAVGLGKRVVLLLNKIDLVPSDVVREWLKHLRREFPTLAFKASTQRQKTNISAPVGARVGRAVRSGEVAAGAGASGAELVLQLIKNYARNNKIKEAVSVGIIGYPNVGKSSVINSLKRNRSVGVSPTPGFTKVVQEVALDRKVKLLDCPGIIFGDSSHDGGAGLLLRNCVSVASLEDPESVVDRIVGQCAPEKLMEVFCIPAFDGTDDFLRLIAERRGAIGKGHVANKTAAARAVLNEWNVGKIPFFTLPPEEAEADPVVDGVAIVEEWSKEFDLDGLLAEEDVEGGDGRVDDYVEMGGAADRSADHDWAPDEEGDEDYAEGGGDGGGMAVDG